MSALGSLEARYADDHVPLALLLGALATLSAVRRALPGQPAGRVMPGADRGSAPEPFVALLLGVVSTHDRLLGLCGPALARRRGDEVETDTQPHAMDGFLR